MHSAQCHSLTTIPQVGFDLNTAAGGIGAEAIIDTTVKDTPIFIRTSTTSSSSSPRSLVLNNIKLTNVPIAVGVTGGATVLGGGTTTIGTWGQGNVYSGTSGTPRFVQGSITTVNKASSLLDSSGKVFGRTHPQYETYDVTQFVSVRDEGAIGDGATDDTAAIKAIFKKVSFTQYLPHNRQLTGIVSTQTAKSYFLMQEPMWFLPRSPFRLAQKLWVKHGASLRVKEMHSEMKRTLYLSSE